MTDTICDPAVGTADAEIKNSSLEGPELKCSLFWPEVGHAMCASLSARTLFLSNFYFPGPFTFIFSELSLDFLALAVANAVLVWTPRINRQPC